MSPPSEEEIYQEHVLDHYEDPYNSGRCEHATHSQSGTNPLCGDKVLIDLRIEDDVIKEAFFEGEGCCISQASASMLMEAIEGKPLAELKEFSANHMLDLFQAKLTPNRQKCCLLGWRVLQEAVHSPIDDDDESSQGSHFLGPNLGEES